MGHLVLVQVQLVLERVVLDDLVVTDAYRIGILRLVLRGQKERLRGNLDVRPKARICDHRLELQ